MTNSRGPGAHPEELEELLESHRKQDWGIRAELERTGQDRREAERSGEEKWGKDEEGVVDMWARMTAGSGWPDSPTTPYLLLGGSYP